MVGTRIKLLRKRAGITQEELAERLGYAKSTIGMYETGAREPSIETLKEIAKILGVDLNTLIGVGDAPATKDILVLSDGEKLLVDLFRSAGPYQQAVILKMIEAAVNSTPRG